MHSACLATCARLGLRPNYKFRFQCYISQDVYNDRSHAALCETLYETSCRMINKCYVGRGVIILKFIDASGKASMFIFGEGGSRILNTGMYTKPYCVSQLIVYAYNNIAINLFVKGVSGYLHKVFIFLPYNNPTLLTFPDHTQLDTHTHIW
jgi:hypothetical protein